MSELRDRFDPNSLRAANIVADSNFDEALANVQAEQAAISSLSATEQLEIQASKNPRVAEAISRIRVGLRERALAAENDEESDLSGIYDEVIIKTVRVMDETITTGIITQQKFDEVKPLLEREYSNQFEIMEEL